MPDGSTYLETPSLFNLADASERQFRDCLGRFATGVTVVTASTGIGMIGITANSFSSVSMTPPLVLWCPAKSSSRYVHFSKAKHFAIHVLDEDQKEVALAFARSGDAFDGLGVFRNAHGVPVFEDCLARLECETRDLHDAGDHAIMVGEVLTAAVREGGPLVFSQGAFRQFDKAP